MKAALPLSYTLRASTTTRRGVALRGNAVSSFAISFSICKRDESYFPKCHHHTQFSLNVYGGPLMVSFDTISNLYDAKGIAECYQGEASAPIPGIKDANGDWNTTGHPDRIIHVTQRELEVFAKLFDGSDKWQQAKLPQLHAKQLIETLECFADSQMSIASLGPKVLPQQCGKKQAVKIKGLQKEMFIFQILLNR